MKHAMQALTPQPVCTPADILATDTLAGHVAPPTLPTGLPAIDPLKLADTSLLVRAAELAQKWELAGGSPVLASSTCK